jgi:hypothetical protein
MSTFTNKRNARRRHLARHLHAAGPRPTLEALIAVEAGQSVDDVLSEFGRVPTEIYQAVGADDFPIKQFGLIKGGRK